VSRSFARSLARAFILSHEIGAQTTCPLAARALLMPITKRASKFDSFQCFYEIISAALKRHHLLAAAAPHGQLNSPNVTDGQVASPNQERLPREQERIKRKFFSNEKLGLKFAWMECAWAQVLLRTQISLFKFISTQHEISLTIRGKIKTHRCIVLYI